jgi:hypothetical protein
MPIILAIEPDRRQAAHLAGIVRQRVGAELILADTTEGALDAIGNRIPDLVLVPALLSPQDDAALAAALRVIAAAAHVRTLTIPVLSNGAGVAPAQPSGMLAKWRRGRAEAVPDGCDPAVFAEQINAYLKEAAAERAELALAPEQDVTEFEPIEPFAAAPVVAMAVEPTAFVEFESIEPETAPIEVMAVEPIAAVDYEPIEAEAAPIELMAVEPIAAMDYEPIEMMAIEPIAVTAAPAEIDEPETEDAAEPWSAIADGEPVIDLSTVLADLEEQAAEEVVEELFAGEPFGVYTISSTVDEAPLELFEEAAIEEAFATQALATTDDAVAIEAAPVDVELAAFEVEVAAIAVAEKDAYEESDFDDDTEDEDEAPCLDIESYVPMYLKTGQMWPPLEGVPVELPTPKSEHPEWLDLIASLREDIERRRGEPAHAPAVAARTADAAGGKENHHVKKQKLHATKEKPVQDEWGFFDPEQCGFSALLAKLDEITDGAEESDGRRPS